MLQKILVVLVSISSLFGSVIAQPSSVVTDSIFSTSLKENRNLKIILPSNYNKEYRDLYATLYVLDGEWYTNLVPNAYEFAKSGGFLPNTIIILIPNVYINGSNQRNRDFEPFLNKNVNGAELFLNFLEKELFSFIDKKYPNNSQKTLLGSSLGGLFTTYAFLTKPDLFDAYLACDPNLDWENGYVLKLALNILPTFNKKNKILFVATNDYSFEANGGKAFKKILQENAPTSLRWQVKTYQDETHYSVQYKAFYDALRFNYLGFWPEKFAFAPMGALIEPTKPLQLFVLNNNPAVCYTLDGLEPTEKSPRFSPDQSIVISKSTILKVKTIATRPQYEDLVVSTFDETSDKYKIKSNYSKDTSTTHSSFKGTWTELPLIKLTDDTYSIHSRSIDKNYTSKIFIINKKFKVDNDCYYIFVIDSPNGSRLYLGDKILINNVNNPDSRLQSFGVYLKKGYYNTTVQMLQLKNREQPRMRIFKTTTSNSKWWENEI